MGKNRKWNRLDNLGYHTVYTSISIKKDVAVAVGWRDSKALITIGRRN